MTYPAGIFLGESLFNQRYNDIWIDIAGNGSFTKTFVPKGVKLRVFQSQESLAPIADFIPFSLTQVDWRW